MIRLDEPRAEREEEQRPLQLARERWLQAREELFAARMAYAEEIERAERLLGVPHRIADFPSLLKPQAG